MIILLNADKILKIHSGFEKQLEKKLLEDFRRYDGFISRIDLHITDENGIKRGANDIKCVLEAHVTGRQPIVVTAEANSTWQSIHGAAKKLKLSIDSMIGKKRNRPVRIMIEQTLE